MKKVVAIRKTGPDTFRRAGLQFSRVPAEYELTPEQYALIKSDPMFVVTNPKKD